MPEEAEEQNHEEDDGVIHTEVREIGSDPSESVVEVGRESEGAVIGHEPPWAAVAEAVFEALFGAGDVLEVGGDAGRGGGGGSRNGAVVGHRRRSRRRVLTGFGGIWN